jgi:ABC-type transporter Mla MlaB component
MNFAWEVSAKISVQLITRVDSTGCVLLAAGRELDVIFTGQPQKIT